MKKKTRSILEELNSLHRPNKDHSINSAATNIIQSSINLIERIRKTYEPEVASDLERRFLNSIRSGDMRKFKRGMQKVIESKSNKRLT